MRALAVVLLALVLSFVPATAATAQLGPNVPSPLTEPEPPPPPSAPEEDTGLTLTQKILIFGSAAAILALIGWLIVRDAHKAAPVEEEQTRVPEAKRMSTRERERLQQQRRAKAKAVKNQRRKNRPH